MITITVKGMEFRYWGRIQLVNDGTFLQVKAESSSPFAYNDRYDAFWLSEIESITGEHDAEEARPAR